jgi:hypothetical protein
MTLGNLEMPRYFTPGAKEKQVREKASTGQDKGVTYA